MSSPYQACAPVYYPSPGDEDPREHSVTAGRLFYTVGVGYAPGIYNDEALARDQVSGFSNARWKKSPTYEGAVAIWKAMCERHHDHDASPPASPSPTPSPPPVTRPPPRKPPPKTPGRPPAPAPVVRISHSMRTPASPRRSVAPLVLTPSPTKTVAARSSLPLPASSSRSGLAQRALPVQVESSHKRGAWREGETLWGIEGTPLLFEDRYDLVDHIFVQRLSPARVMETRNRRKLVAFVGEEAYVRVPGDPEDSD